VELENSHPSVVVDLGSGPHRINSDVSVRPDVWYQYIVERSGKHVKLTIREEGRDGDILHVKEEVISGKFHRKRAIGPQRRPLIKRDL